MNGRTARTARNVGNIANLSTPLGLILALVCRARLRRRRGLIVADSAHLGFIPAGAITVGSVVLIPRLTLEELEQRIPTVMAHEEEHAWQWAACLGLPFIPLYFAATIWSWLRTGDRASANFFEQQAGLERGGYRIRPVQRRRREAERSA